MSVHAVADERAQWHLDDVVRTALAQRPELTAARARVEAARERPAIVSALDDPMLSPAIDHYPFKMMPSMEEDNRERRYDWNIGIEQRFPFSRLLTHRRHAAEAEADKAVADAERTALDVELEAVSAFFMVNEKRRMAALVTGQIDLAHQFVSAASARYSAGTGSQSEVLRAEVEVARLAAAARALQSETRAAETMLNTSLGRAPGTEIPELVSPVRNTPLPSKADVEAAVMQRRPELRSGAAEVTRAGADVAAMRSMYLPMGMVRLGYASTMADGRGAMLMVGVSLPIWRAKLRSQVAEAQAMERMAVADLDAMRRMAGGEAAAARDQLEAAQLQFVGLRDDVSPRAQRLIAPALSSYAAGQGSLVAVVEAAQALRSVQAELVMAETALGLAWARLDRMTGTPQDRTR